MIGLNYVYYRHKDKIILRSYLTLFWIILKEINDECEINDLIAIRIINKLKTINTKTAKNMIKNADEKLFDSVLIKKLMFLSYDYEIWEKFLWRKIVVNKLKINRIISTINKIYWINYKKEINLLDTKYYKPKEYNKLSKQVYINSKSEIEKYIKILSEILEKSWYEEESSNIINVLDKSIIKIKYCDSNSSYTRIVDDEIYLYLNNKTKTTLYHEFTHTIQQIIRNIYNIKLKWFETTLQNEWIANFMAYNLFENIETGELEIINLNHLFFPKYSYLYKKIYSKWSNNSKKNYNLLKKNAQKLWYKEENEILNLYYRFFKFLPLNQNKYLYPKELLYKIWYEKIIKSFVWKNPIRHLADLLLYKT